MEPYFRNIYPFLILRRLNIVPDPLSIFSFGNKTKLKFDDFEYIGGPKEKCVDGYEINIFEESDKDIFHQIDKKYLDSNFIGNRHPGDIGCLLEEQTKNGVSYKCLFSKEIHAEFFPKIFKLYKNSDQTKESNNKIVSILVEGDRDKKINDII